jgi:hypothetical protein
MTPYKWMHPEEGRIAVAAEEWGSKLKWRSPRYARPRRYIGVIDETDARRLSAQANQPRKAP